MTWDRVEDAFARLKVREQSAYLGFYSSWLGGFFSESWAMTVPLDDHGFHRGDGVFEAVRIFRRGYIDLDAHVARLHRSAGLIGLTVPGDVRAICLKLATLCNADEGVLRLYVTRGPGSFSPNPAESVGAQIYAAITTIKPPSARMYEEGCRAMISTVPAKEPAYARIKSLNYLQNVMMKKECVERGFDLSVCFDDEGRLCEGATENILIVSASGRVVVPPFDYTLPGTTVKGVMELAGGVDGVTGVEQRDLTREDLAKAREVAFVGTTLGVLPVGVLDDRALGAGPIARELHRRWSERMATDPRLRTAF